MKIICIEGNYKCTEENFLQPTFLIKPDSSLLRNAHPFFIPDHANNFTAGIHLVLKISRLGKNIQEKFAHLYYNEIGLGADITAKDSLKICRENGLPWDSAKCYDSSAPLGNFIPIDSLKKSENIPFSLQINNQVVINANSPELIWGFNKIIEFVSKFMILKTGDLIFTGSPKVSDPLKINDRVEGFIDNSRLLWFNIK